MKNEKINILHVIVQLPLGGAENMLAQAVRSCDRERFHPIVCCIRRGGPVADMLMNEGYEVIVLNRMMSHRIDLKAVQYLYKIMKERNIHVVQAHQYHANFYGRIAACLARIPCILATVHSVYAGDKKFHRRLLNKCLALCTDKIIAVSDTVKKDILHYDGISEEKIMVVYNGIPLDSFCSAVSKEEARKILGLPDNMTIIGTVGRLVKQKGHRYLLEAAAYLRDCGIAIAGDGPLKEELMKYAKDLNVYPVFLGMLGHEKVPFFLKAIDIFCFPSLSEGFGIALAEAMSAGLPIIASDIPTHREVLGDAGIFTPPGDSTKLADSLRMLTADDTTRRRLKEKARKRSSIFSARNMARSYEELIINIIEKKRAECASP